MPVCDKDSEDDENITSTDEECSQATGVGSSATFVCSYVQKGPMHIENGNTCVNLHLISLVWALRSVTREHQVKEWIINSSHRPLLL